MQRALCVCAQVALDEIISLSAANHLAIRHVYSRVIILSVHAPCLKQLFASRMLLCCGGAGEREREGHPHHVHVCQIMREEPKANIGGGEELIISRALSSN